MSRSSENFETEDVDGIRESCQYFNNLSEEFYDIFHEVKIVYGEEHQDDFGDRFETTFTKITDVIKLGRDKIKKLHAEKEATALAERDKAGDVAKKNHIKDQEVLADVLLNEIKLRQNALSTKCDTTILDSMSDHQILSFQKMMCEIDSELRELMREVTRYSNILVSCGGDVTEKLVAPRKIQDECLSVRNEYAKHLHQIISERDISEEKLKASSGLKIELSKFSGYDSKLDIYSFQSEFEKIVQPTVLKKFWVDTLKKNYLSGDAYTLVEKCETMDEIWKKLIDAYGNVKLLLQNKILKLDKIDNLGSIKSDEKLGTAISKIVNMMTDLSNLAEKHDLETKLYIGGGLERVLSLLGNVWEKKFLRKNIELTRKSQNLSEGLGDSPVRVLNELSREKQVWNNLKVFLSNEATLCEQLALVQRTKDSLGIKVSKKDPADHSAHFTAPNLLCHICGDSGHVVSSDRTGRKHIDYVACKKFAEASPAVRQSLLMKNHLCFQCLLPGMKCHEEHNCPKRYVCPHASHASFQKGLHVLLCEDHKGESVNSQILNEYMEHVIKNRAPNFENFTNSISLFCYTAAENLIPDEGEDSAIFMLQTIDTTGVSVNMCYDSASCSSVIKKSCVDAFERLGRVE